MAYNTGSSLLGQIFILSILLAVAGKAVAGRGSPRTEKNTDVKQPEWLLGSDRSLLIPGIGRVMLPPGLGTPYSPYPGSVSIGGTGAPSGYLPGGDDTFVPNPGFEVPSPDLKDCVRVGTQKPTILIRMKHRNIRNTKRNR